MVTERDNYKMPELFTGEVTPEIRKKMAKNKAEVEKRKQQLKEVYRKRKASII